MIELGLACLAIFTYVAAKAFQQRNVVGDHYIAIMPVSIIMAMMEFYVVGFIALTGFSIVKGIALGLSGGTGCIISMLMHKRIFSGKAKAEPAHPMLRPAARGTDRDGGEYPIDAVRPGGDIPLYCLPSNSAAFKRRVDALAAKQRHEPHDCSGWFRGCVICMDRILADYKRNTDGAG